jgi:hypothetical protein
MRRLLRCLVVRAWLTFRNQGYDPPPPLGQALKAVGLLQVKIAMVGKYTNLSDAYLSVIKSLQHACLAANRKLDILWVEASHLEPQTEKDEPEAYKVDSPPLIALPPPTHNLLPSCDTCTARQSGSQGCALSA